MGGRGEGVEGWRGEGVRGGGGEGERAVTTPRLGDWGGGAGGGVRGW